MLREVLGALTPQTGEKVVDCTLGFGGHAQALAQAVGPEGLVLGLDVDDVALKAATARLQTLPQMRTERANFADLPRVLDESGIGPVDIIFADLGTSGMQIDDPARGINYDKPGPLDMRLDTRQVRSAVDVLDETSPQELSAALRDLSDEPDHQRIAEWICRSHQMDPIRDTQRLVRLVLDAKGIIGADRRYESWKRPGAAHPAARTFQTLRILVNDELGSLRALLAAGPQWLTPGGRIGILSFQPGEDRLVKESLGQGLSQGLYEAASLKPICPRAAERGRNTRSTSARLRWARRSRR